MNQTILMRLPAVIACTGQKKSTVYKRMEEGVFPQSVALGPRAVAWPENEVHAINAARIAGRSDDEIRALVKKLEAARKTAECERAK